MFPMKVFVYKMGENYGDENNANVGNAPPKICPHGIRGGCDKVCPEAPNGNRHAKCAPYVMQSLASHGEHKCCHGGTADANE